MNPRQTELTVVETGQSLAPIPTGGDVSKLLDRAVELLQTENAESAVAALGKLLEYQERYEDRQAVKAFNQAFANFQANKPTIRKTKHVSTKGGMKFDYPPLPEIVDAIDPGLRANGFCISFSQLPADKPGNVKMRCELIHLSGHSKFSDYEGPLDDKNPGSMMHRGSGASSLAQRKALLQVLALVPVGADSGEGYNEDDNQGITTDQANELAALMTKAGVAEARILKPYRVNSVMDLSVADWQRAKANLNDVIRAREQGAGQ